MSLCGCCRAEHCYKAYLWCERGPEHPRAGMSQAEADDLTALAKGRPVPGHLGACAVLSCSHSVMRHDRPSGTSSRPGAACLVPGCPCPGLVKHELTPVALIHMDPDGGEHIPSLDSSQVAG